MNTTTNPDQLTPEPAVPMTPTASQDSQQVPANPQPGPGETRGMECPDQIADPSKMVRKSRHWGCIIPSALVLIAAIVLAYLYFAPLSNEDEVRDRFSRLHESMETLNAYGYSPFGIGAVHPTKENEALCPICNPTSYRWANRFASDKARYPMAYPRY